MGSLSSLICLLLISNDSDPAPVHKSAHSVTYYPAKRTPRMLQDCLPKVDDVLRTQTPGVSLGTVVKKDSRHFPPQFAGPVFHTVQRGEMNHYFREGSGLLCKEPERSSFCQVTTCFSISCCGAYPANKLISSRLVESVRHFVVPRHIALLS